MNFEMTLPSTVFAALDRFDDIDEHFRWSEDQYYLYLEANEEFGDEETISDLL